MTYSSRQPSPIPNFTVLFDYCKQHTIFTNLGSICFDVKHFQLKLFSKKTLYFPIFGCHLENILLFGWHWKTFSASGMAPVGVDAAEEDVVYGVCHGVDVCQEERSLKKKAMDGNCFPPLKKNVNHFTENK
jgi:hypothetical protein